MLLGSEASVLLQWQTTTDNVSRGSMLVSQNNDLRIHTVKETFVERIGNYRGGGGGASERG